jgi:hypothetical protein
MMNQLLMQMIASRTGGCANPALADLLARMRSGDSGSALNVEDLLAQQAQTNPMAAMLAKQIAEQKAMRAAQERSPVIDVEATAETGADGTVENGGQGDEAAAALCELRENMKGMLAELELLRERNDALAAAVGACCLCWGQNLECRSCRGRGGPGFCMPDEPLFEEFVLPAVRTLRAQRAKNKSYSPQVQTSLIGSKNQ